MKDCNYKDKISVYCHVRVEVLRGHIVRSHMIPCGTEPKSLNLMTTTRFFANEQCYNFNVPKD